MPSSSCAIWSSVFVGALSQPTWAQQTLEFCGPHWEGFWGELQSPLPITFAMVSSGQSLYLGGKWQLTSDPSKLYILERTAMKDWIALPPLNDRVFALEIWDQDGSGPLPPALIAGGEFTTAGGHLTNRIAKWTGTWSNMGAGLGEPDKYSGNVLSLVSFDVDETGPALPTLIAGGSFQHINPQLPDGLAWWTGTSWAKLGQITFSGSVFTFHVWDDDGPGPNPSALYAGGSFNLNGLVNIAKWTGTEWVAVGSGLPNLFVFALTSFDPDGPGPTPEYLIAAGGGRLIWPDIYRWDGASWMPFGGNTNSEISCLEVFDENPQDCVPPMLYAGGYLGNGAMIAKWDGVNWHPVSTFEAGPAGPNSPFVKVMAVFDDDGASPLPSSLYVGGKFNSVGSAQSAGSLARWGVQGFGCATDIAPNGGCDGVIDSEDLLAVIASWGATCTDADVNVDGLVNAVDLLAIITTWGICPAP